MGHPTRHRDKKVHAPAVRLAVLVPADAALVAVAGRARLAVPARARSRRHVQGGVGARASAETRLLLISHIPHILGYESVPDA